MVSQGSAYGMNILLLAYNPSQERKKKTCKVQKRNGAFMLWYLLLPWRFGRWTDELEQKKEEVNMGTSTTHFFLFLLLLISLKFPTSATYPSSKCHKQNQQQLGKNEKRMMVSSQFDTYFPKWRRVWTEKPQMLQSCQHGHYYH